MIYIVSPCSYGLKVRTNVEVFVHATDADKATDKDTRAKTLAPQT